MAKRHPNYRLLKQHAVYSTEELALVLGKTKRTIQNWMNQGLAPIDSRRPYLFRGKDVVEFLKKRRASAKRPLGPGELYCFKCRAPKVAKTHSARLETDDTGCSWLRGDCADCGCAMHRRVNQDRVAAALGSVEVQHSMRRTRLSDVTAPLDDFIKNDERNSARPERIFRLRRDPAKQDRAANHVVKSFIENGLYAPRPRSGSRADEPEFVTKLQRDRRLTRRNRRNKTKL